MNTVNDITKDFGTLYYQNPLWFSMKPKEQIQQCTWSISIWIATERLSMPTH